MTVIAYTYEADYHCIDCTRARYQSNGFYDRYGKQWRWDYGGQLDWNGVVIVLYDNEANMVHPLFSTDEWQELDDSFLEENPTQYLTCGTCHEIIDEFTTEN